MAQRLVRQLCPVCKTTYTPTKEELTKIKDALKSLPAGNHPALENAKLGKPVGCPACHHFGYQGRISIMEQLEITPDLEDLIAHGTAATTSAAIEQAAVRNGMITILQDGMNKVLENLTTLEEVLTQVGE